MTICTRRLCVSAIGSCLVRVPPSKNGALYVEAAVRQVPVPQIIDQYVDVQVPQPVHVEVPVDVPVDQIIERQVPRTVQVPKFVDVPVEVPVEHIEHVRREVSECVHSGPTK